MSDIKINIIHQIHSYSELQNFVKKYYQTMLKTTHLNQKFTQEKNSLTQKYHNKITPLNTQLAQLKKSIFKYIINNKQILFHKRKSLNLDCVSIGFRKISELYISDDQSHSIISQLKSLNKQDCITIKESIKKSALSLWSDKELALLGLKRIISDKPYIAINQSKIL